MFAVAIPTKNRLQKQQMFFIVRYGIPARFHSKMQTFESQIIKELCEVMGIHKSRTTPYHASGIGMTERFDRTLISMLGTLDIEKKNNWIYFGPSIQLHKT